MAINKRIIKSNDGGAAVATSFNTVTYTGTGSPITRTDVGFQPDLVWIKGRDDTWDHFLTNSITNGALRSNKTLAETANPDFYFNSDGFTTPVGGSWTQSGEGYVAWCWKAAGYANTFNVLENGVTTTGSTVASVGISTSGSNSTLVGASINKDAGFSITTHSIEYAYPEWISHGLGVIPDLVITKPRSTNEGWSVNIGPGVIDSNNWVMSLNTTNAASINSRQMTSTVVPLTYTPQTQTFVSYAFKSVPGFSKFGSYTGTSPSPITITTGFEPAFIMVKSYSAGSGKDWVIYDNKRNNADNYLLANTSGAEGTYNNVDFTSTGFNIVDTGSSLNQNGTSYIYMAFANQF